jgi:pimeloyl-ACP methyl ester carboxylesterase
VRTFLIGLAVVVAALVGTYFYFSVPEIPRAALVAKYGTTPSKFVRLPDGALLHYRDRGPKNASALLLLHGSNASLFTWEPWTQRLDSSFRVVAIDLPGHGLTGAVPSNDYSQAGMVEFTKEAADKLGLRKFAIAGNSMGGGVAAHFAEEYPDRVTALILVDAGGMPGKQGDHVPIGFRIGRIPVLNKLLLHLTPRAMFKEGLDDSLVHKAVITDAMVEQYWELNRMQGTPEATLARFNEPFGSYVKDHIGQIKAPTLILWGAEDHLVPVDAAHAFNAAIPGSKLIIFPGNGHVLQEDDPDETAADVRAFLGNTVYP